VTLHHNMGKWHHINW